MKYEDIKNPIDLIEYMDSNIKYGFLDEYGNGYDLLNDSEAVNYIDKWTMSTPEEVLEHGYAMAFDQVEFERDWFVKNNYEVRTYAVTMNVSDEGECAIHTFLVYSDNGKWSLFENADGRNKGIYTFDFINQAITFEVEKHIENNASIYELTDDMIRSIKIYEYTKPEYGIDMSNFMSYIFEKSIEATGAILIEEDDSTYYDEEESDEE